MGNYVQLWHNKKAILQLFGTQRKRAVVRYCAFIKAGINDMKDMDLSGGGLICSYGGWDSITEQRREHEMRIGDERILGDSDFFLAVLKNDELMVNKKTNWQQLRWDLKRLVYVVCDYFEIKVSDLKQKGRQNSFSNAKSVICYSAIHELCLSSTDIAKYLAMSQPAISKSAKRGALFCQEIDVNVEILGIN